MESISFTKTLIRPIPFQLPISSPRPSSIFSKPHPHKFCSFSNTLRPLRAYQGPSSPSAKTTDPLSSFLKPALLSLTAAAAVLLSRHSIPSLAAAPLRPPPIGQSESLPASSDDPGEQLLEDHLASHPNDVESLRALLHLKVKHQKLPEAISVVDRLILLEPVEHDLHLLKAHLHTHSGDTGKAREGFEQVLSENPFVVEAYHGLVMAASRSGDTKELAGVVERVEGVMRLCERENKGRELRDLKLLVAQVRIIEGRFQEALEIYQVMVTEEPRDFRPYLCQGIVYSLMRKMDEADKNFKQYRKLVPKDHPYAQLFETNLSGMNTVLERNGRNEKVGSLQS